MVVESAPMLSDEDIAALVKDFYSTILAKDDHHRLMADVPDQFREARADHYRQLAESAKEHLAENAYNNRQQMVVCSAAGFSSKLWQLSRVACRQAVIRQSTKSG